MIDPAQAAQAALEAYLQGVYGLTAGDVPNMAARLKPTVAASLRAALDLQQVADIRTAPGCFEFDRVIRVSDLLAVIEELEAA